MTPALWALVELCALAVVLVWLYYRSPKCPKCGSIKHTRDTFRPEVRSCLSCQEVYEVRES